MHGSDESVADLAAPYHVLMIRNHGKSVGLLVHGVLAVEAHWLTLSDMMRIESSVTRPDLPGIGTEHSCLVVARASAPFLAGNEYYDSGQYLQYRILSTVYKTSVPVLYRVLVATTTSYGNGRRDSVVGSRVAAV